MKKGVDRIFGIYRKVLFVSPRVVVEDDESSRFHQPECEHAVLHYVFTMVGTIYVDEVVVIRVEASKVHPRCPGQFRHFLSEAAQLKVRVESSLNGGIAK